MKKLILQVNVKIDDHTGMKRYKPNEDLYALSEKQARKFAKEWGADYHVVTDNSFLPDKHPIYQRFKMYDFTEYDQILYLDMDAVVLNGCPNLFELCEGHRFSAVQDAPWDKDPAKYEPKRQKLCEIYEIPESDYRPFCSGVMLVTKEFLNDTKDMWKKFLYTYDKRGERDQGVFNKLVIETGEVYNELGPDWGAWFRSSKYIEHIGGPFKKRAYDHEKFMAKHGLDDDPSPLESFME